MSLPWRTATQPSREPPSPSAPPSWPALLLALVRRYRVDLFAIAATALFVVLAAETGLVLLRAR